MVQIFNAKGQSGAAFQQNLMGPRKQLCNNKQNPAVQCIVSAIFFTVVADSESTNLNLHLHVNIQITTFNWTVIGPLNSCLWIPWSHKTLL